MSKRKFNLLFRLKKPRNYDKGNMHVYMRITVDSTRVEIATGREFDPTRWNYALGRAIGKKEDAYKAGSFLF